MSKATTTRVTDWWLERVRKHAAPQLEQGESVQAASYGQETRWQLFSYVCFWRARLVASTETNLYVFKSGAFNSSKVGDLLEKRPLASDPLAHQSQALVIGERVIWPPPGAGVETRQLLESVGVARPAQAPDLPATEQAPQAGPSVTQPPGSTPPPGMSVPPPGGAA